MTTQTSISYDDYLKLKGLHLIAREHGRAQEAAIAAAASVLGFKNSDGSNYHGILSDDFYDEQSTIEATLGRLDIEVEPSDG